MLLGSVFTNPPPLRHFGLLGSKAKAFPFEFLAKKSILLFCTISTTIVDLREKNKNMDFLKKVVKSTKEKAVEAVNATETLVRKKSVQPLLCPLGAFHK